MQPFILKGNSIFFRVVSEKDIRYIVDIDYF